MDKYSLGSCAVIIGVTAGVVVSAIKTIKEIKGFNPKLCSPFMAEFGPEAAKKKD